MGPVGRPVGDPASGSERDLEQLAHPDGGQPLHRQLERLPGPHQSERRRPRGPLRLGPELPGPACGHAAHVAHGHQPQRAARLHLDHPAGRARGRGSRAARGSGRPRGPGPSGAEAARPSAGTPPAPPHSGPATSGRAPTTAARPAAGAGASARPRDDLDPAPERRRGLRRRRLLRERQQAVLPGRPPAHAAPGRGRAPPRTRRARPASSVPSTYSPAARSRCSALSNSITPRHSFKAARLRRIHDFTVPSGVAIALGDLLVGETIHEREHARTHLRGASRRSRQRSRLSVSRPRSSSLAVRLAGVGPARQRVGRRATRSRSGWRTAFSARWRTMV